MKDNVSKGNWSTGKHQGIVVTDSGDGFPNNPDRGHSDVDYYGGFLIAESIMKPDDVKLLSAARDMAEALASIENDDGNIPEAIWKMRNDALKKADWEAGGKPTEMGKVPDGYHTFDELYQHRIALFMQVCRLASLRPHLMEVWKSEKHSDGSVIDGWFVIGIHTEPGKQITYHLPLSRWGECYFAKTIEVAPEFDGHTSYDVVQRILKLF